MMSRRCARKKPPWSANFPAFSRSCRAIGRAGRRARRSDHMLALGVDCYFAFLGGGAKADEQQPRKRLFISAFRVAPTSRNNKKEGARANERAKAFVFSRSPPASRRGGRHLRPAFCSPTFTARHLRSLQPEGEAPTVSYISDMLRRVDAIRRHIQTEERGAAKSTIGGMQAEAASASSGGGGGGGSGGQIERLLNKLSLFERDVQTIIREKNDAKSRLAKLEAENESLAKRLEEVRRAEHTDARSQANRELENMREMRESLEKTYREEMRQQRQEMETKARRAATSVGQYASSFFLFFAGRAARASTRRGRRFCEARRGSRFRAQRRSS